MVPVKLANKACERADDVSNPMAVCRYCVILNLVRTSWQQLQIFTQLITIKCALKTFLCTLILNKFPQCKAT